MSRFIPLFFALLLAFPASLAWAADAPGAYIISPEDGATVSNPVTVVFGLKGMGVAPSGVQRDNTGHFHLLIDAQPVPSGQVIPSDDQHVHFGGGQIQTTMELPPGEHTLRLEMGNSAHIVHDPSVVSEPITITVK